MTGEIKVPSLGGHGRTAIIADWIRKPGERVSVNEPIVKLKTGTTIIHVSAPGAGVLSEIMAGEGSEVDAGRLLGRIRPEGTGLSKTLKLKTLKLLSAGYVLSEPAVNGDEKSLWGSVHFIPHHCDQAWCGSVYSFEEPVPGRPYDLGARVIAAGTIGQDVSLIAAGAIGQDVSLIGKLVPIRISGLFDHIVPISSIEHHPGGIISVGSLHDKENTRLSSLSAKLKKEFDESVKRPDSGEIKSVVVPEADRLALLESAGRVKSADEDPIRELEGRIRTQTVELLGGEAVLGRLVRSDEELVQALMVGFPGQVLRKLQNAGYPHKVLEKVIAPRRTLMRRRAPDQRLTSIESDAAWRLARLLVLASDVLNGPRAAISWLSRPKAVFDDKAPVDLVETSVGAGLVERLLKRLDWGDVA